jgi:hypothetical protein
MKKNFFYLEKRVASKVASHHWHDAMKRRKFFNGFNPGGMCVHGFDPTHQIEKRRKKVTYSIIHDSRVRG